MPSIPYPSQPRAPQLEQPGVRLDAGALSAGARGAQAFGAGLQDAAGVIVSHEIQVQQHVNEGILANEDTIRRNVAAEIENNITSNEGDISSWERFARDKKAEYESNRQLRAQDEQWDSEVTRVDELNSKEFFSRQEVALGATVTKASVKKSNARIEANAQMYANAGAWDAAHKSISRMNLTEDQRADVSRRITMQAGYNAATNDPQGTLDTLQAKNEDGTPAYMHDLTPQERYSLEGTAKNVLGTRRTEYQNALGERKFAGQEITHDELAKAIDSGLVTAAWATGFEKQQARDLAGDKASPEQVSKLDDITIRVNTYDPDTTSAHDLHKLQLDINLLPARIASDISETLAKKTGDKKSPLNSEVTTQAHANVNDFFRAINTDDLVPVAARDDEKTGAHKPASFEKVQNPEKQAAAISAQAKAHDAVNAYVTAADPETGKLLHPSPTVDELRAVALPFFRSVGREAPKVNAATGQVQGAQSNVTSAQYDKLKSGEPYWWQGKQYRKD